MSQRETLVERNPLVRFQKHLGRGKRAKEMTSALQRGQQKPRRARKKEQKSEEHTEAEEEEVVVVEQRRWG